jgi:hypothetical protein
MATSVQYSLTTIKTQIVNERKYAIHLDLRKREHGHSSWLEAYPTKMRAGKKQSGK